MTTTNSIEQVESGDPGRPGMGLGEGNASLPRPSRRVSSQIIVLILVVGVSVSALYAMRRYGMQSGFKFDTVDVDYKDPNTEKARSYERIMADLAAAQKPLDLALGDLGKSPFMRDPTPSTIIRPVVPDTIPATSPEERHRQEASAALKAMHLNGIIGNIARIDEETVKAGDKLGELFTVKSVDGRTVTLVAYDEEYTLTMEAKPHDPKKSPTKMRGLQDRRP